MVEPAGTRNVPPVVPIVVPPTETTVTVPPRTVTSTATPKAFVAATVEAGTAGGVSAPATPPVLRETWPT
jgi:hypothetical protein